MEQHHLPDLRHFSLRITQMETYSANIPHDDTPITAIIFTTASTAAFATAYAVSPS